MKPGDVIEAPDYSQQEEPSFTRQYLHDEISKLRNAFGLKSFWRKNGAEAAAAKALGFVYFNTDGLQQPWDETRFRATLEELRRRGELVAEMALRDPDWLNEELSDVGDKEENK